MSGEVALLVHIEVLPGRGDEQIALFRDLQPQVLAEAGCLQYELKRDANNADRFVLIERWASEAALAAHDQTSHMLAADAYSPRFRAGPAQVLRLLDI